MRDGGDDLDSEAILKQGDELLRSSRRLLDDLDGVVPTGDEDDDQSATERDDRP